MDAVAFAGVAGLVTAVGSTVIGGLGWASSRRAGKETLGLEQIKLALVTQQEQITRLSQEVNHLHSDVEKCERDKADMAIRLAQLERAI